MSSDIHVAFDAPFQRFTSNPETWWCYRVLIGATSVVQEVQDALPKGHTFLFDFHDMKFYSKTFVFQTCSRTKTSRERAGVKAQSTCAPSKLIAFRERML